MDQWDHIKYYIYDKYGPGMDSLMAKIGRYPIRSDYRLGQPMPYDNTINYTSAHHVVLATFLHRLGLRGLTQ